MKNDRLFAITYTLINKKSITAPELARQFDVSVRTIYRDIDTLSANGIPIYCVQGKGGGISILDHYSIDKTILSDTEQDQVLMALQSLQVTGQLDVENSISKLASLFHKDLDNWIEVDFSGWGQNDKEKEIFTLIRNSIHDSTLLTFTYFSNKGVESKRIVEPYKLVFKGMQWYLYAYCRTRNDYRFFKLSRMKQLSSLADTFHKSSSQSDSFESTTYSMGEPLKISLLIDKCMAFRVYDEFKNAKITLENDKFFVQAQMPKNDWLIHYLLGFGNALEIVEPQELRDEISKKLKEILNKYL